MKMNEPSIKRLAKLGLLVCASTMFACSPKAWYDITRQHQQSECSRIPTGTELEECNTNTPPEYKTYELEREQMLKKNKESIQ